MNNPPRPLAWALLATLGLAGACVPGKAYLGGITDGASTTTAAPDEETTTSGATGITTGGDELGGPCRPVETNTCPMGYVCCSDDPAVLGGRRPNYYMDGVDNEQYGPPLFSDANNALSYWGHCIDVGGFASPLGNGCPVPCDPIWPVERIGEICGTATCCPFTAVDPAKDCILDPVTQRWRTVHGTDLNAGVTEWGAAHATNQDPSLDSCELIAGADPDVKLECIAQLTVADRRGFCYALSCPCVEDVCAMKNPDYVPRCG